jgi:hypothetical protein
LVGEKFVYSDHYEDGQDFGDDANVYSGLNWGNIRTAGFAIPIPRGGGGGGHQNFFRLRTFRGQDRYRDTRINGSGGSPSLFHIVSRPPHQDSPSPPGPDDGYYDYFDFGSAHSGTFGMVFCDGSVHSIDYSIDLDVHHHLANRADGQPIVRASGFAE